MLTFALRFVRSSNVKRGLMILAVGFVLGVAIAMIALAHLASSACGSVGVPGIYLCKVR